MSAFSNHLQVLFQRTGLSVYAMSKACGVERTFLHKILKGTRIPTSEAVVERIAGALRLEGSEARVLYRQYQICRDGEEAVERRGAVASLLAGLSLPNPSAPFVVRHHVDVQSVPPVATDRGTVLRLLRLLLEVEVSLPQGHIQLFCTSEDELLWQLLGMYLDTRPDLPVLQILCLHSGGTHRALLHNLELLRQTLRLTLTGNRYQAMVYYGAQFSPLLPNLLLTSRYALQFSQDCSFALLCDDPHRVSLFHTLLDRQLRDCHPLIRSSRDPLHLLEELQRREESQDKQEMMFTLAAHPWAMPFLSPQQLEGHLSGAVKGPEIRDQVLSYRTHSRRMMEHCQVTHYFTISGLAHMAQSGRIWELPVNCKSPLSAAECREILAGHLEMAETYPGYTPLALDGDMLELPANVVVEAASSGRVSLICDHPQMGPLSFFLEDPALCNALFDYLNSLRQSRFTKSREDTLSLLRRTAQGL